MTTAQQTPPQPQQPRPQPQAQTNYTPTFSGFNWGRVIRYAWLAALGWVAVLNAQPYIALINSLSKGITEVPVLGLLLKVPIIGGLLSLLGMVAPSIVAIAVYGLIQLVQCLPMFLEDPGQIRARISLGEKWQQLPIKDTDPEWLNSLKERFNRLPIEWVEGLHTASRVSYLVDCVLAGLQYPLFKMGWVAAAQNWSTLSLSSVQWGNVPGFVLMVFALEGAIWVYLKLSVGASLLQGGARR